MYLWSWQVLTHYVHQRWVWSNISEGYTHRENLVWIWGLVTKYTWYNTIYEVAMKYKVIYRIYRPRKKDRNDDAQISDINYKKTKTSHSSIVIITDGFNYGLYFNSPS